MTIDQRVTVSTLQSQGFKVEQEGKSIRVVRGNDYRLVMADGSQRRAEGAKR